MILELLPSSRASTLETNCVCNYSALLHLITGLLSEPGLRGIDFEKDTDEFKESLVTFHYKKSLDHLLIN